MKPFLQVITLAVPLVAVVSAVALAPAASPKPAQSDETVAAERQLNLHRHAVGVRVARAVVPGVGVPLRVVPLHPATPDVRERLKPTQAQLVNGQGVVVSLQLAADGELVGAVPMSWLRASGAQVAQLVVWSGNRKIADVSVGYLLP